MRFRSVRAGGITLAVVAGLSSVSSPSAWGAPKTCETAPAASAALGGDTASDVVSVSGANTCAAHQRVTITVNVVSANCDVATLNTVSSKSLGPNKAFSTSLSVPADCTGEAEVTVSNGVGNASDAVTF